MIYRGQTLLGLVFSLGLSSFLLLAIIGFYSYSQQQNQLILQQLQLQAELQRVIQLIAKDLRRAGFRALSEKVIHSNFHLFEQDEQPVALTIARADSENRNSCVLFFYDLDMNGCLGTKFKGGSCADKEQNTTQEIERELFGYRLNNKMLETRLTYKNAVNQSCQKAQCQRYLQQSACNGGGWVDLLDDKEYEITQLNFQWIADQKGIEVLLSGRLMTNNEISYTTTAVIPLLNNEDIP